MKYLFSIILLLLAAIGCFQVEMYADLFLAYSILCVTLTPLGVIGIALMDTPTAKEKFTSFYTYFGNVMNSGWVIVWGVLIQNDYFYTGLMGIFAVVFTFVTLILVQDKIKENKNG